MAKPYRCYWREYLNIPNPEIIYIYALVDPETKERRYVGKTYNVAKRVHLHLTAARKGNKTPNALWLKSLLDRNLRPEVEILEDAPFLKWQERERYWLAKARQENWNVTNVAGAGGGP